MTADFNAPIFYGLRKVRQPAAVYTSDQHSALGLNLSPSKIIIAEVLEKSGLFGGEQQEAGQESFSVQAIATELDSKDEVRDSASASKRKSIFDGAINFLTGSQTIEGNAEHFLEFFSGFSGHFRMSSGEIVEVVIDIESRHYPLENRSVLTISRSPKEINVGISFERLPFIIDRSRGISDSGGKIEARIAGNEVDLPNNSRSSIAGSTIAKESLRAVKFEGLVPLIQAVEWRNDELSIVQPQRGGYEYYFLGSADEFRREYSDVHEMSIVPASVVIVGADLELIEILTINVAVPIGSSDGRERAIR